MGLVMGRPQINPLNGPPPACDAQFNSLLDLRRELLEELDRLDAVAAQPDGPTMADFLEDSPCKGAFWGLIRVILLQ
jgi:hypothetical protein